MIEGINTGTRTLRIPSARKPWDLVLYVDVFVWDENEETGASHLPYSFILTLLCQCFNIFMINIGHSWVFKNYTVRVLVKKKKQKTKYLFMFVILNPLRGPKKWPRFKNIGFRVQHIWVWISTLTASYWVALRHTDFWVLIPVIRIATMIPAFHSDCEDAIKITPIEIFSLGVDSNFFVK